MDKIDLQASERPAETPQKIRAQGLIPAVLYGYKVSTESLAVPYQDFEKVFRKAGESAIINLIVNGQSKNVLIQDVQRHYLNGRFLHVDFHAVSMTEKLKAMIPLEFIGVSKAVKEKGGVLLEVLKEVEVECLPADLPQSIEVDISKLEAFEDTIHIKDIRVSDKVEVLGDPEGVVVKVDPPRDVEAELAQDNVGNVSDVAGVAEEPKGEEAEENK